MNSYCELEMSGEKVGLKFGLPALRQIGEKMLKFKLLSGNYYNELGIAHILYAGYCNNCVIKDIVPIKPFEAFYDFVEEYDTDPSIAEKVTAVTKCFEESKFLKRAEPKKDEPEEKKSTGENLTSTKLNPSATEHSEFPQQNTRE